jgi:hypothetical protein
MSPPHAPSHAAPDPDQPAGAPAPSAEPATILDLAIHSQPNDETCGPTCLHAVYRYWNDPIELPDVIATVRSLSQAGVGRGTLAVNLGEHALRRGYHASLTTFNLSMFDPTWFTGRKPGDPELLTAKLKAQVTHKGKNNLKFRTATEAYLDFIALGGEVRLEDPTSRFIASHIRHGRPILTGLSSTYLYQAIREYGPHDDEDDIRGDPAGHFVVLHGYEPSGRLVHIADPLENNPAFARRNYTVPMARLVASILLGVLTYDGNMLVIEPADDKRHPAHRHAPILPHASPAPRPGPTP